MKDNFFTKVSCDRCSGPLLGRTLSWFNNQTICMDCADKEDELKAQMSKRGINPAEYEGCGYIPKAQANG